MYIGHVALNRWNTEGAHILKKKLYTFFFNVLLA